MKWLKGLLIMTALLGPALWLVWQEVQKKHELQGQTIIVSQGSSLHHVSVQLAEQHIIASSRLFRWWAKYQGQTAKVKAGEFYFSGHINIPDVLAKLVNGEVVFHRVTIPEGLRTIAVLQLLAQQTEVPLKQWQASLDGLLGKEVQEGRLLPETYTYRLPLKPKIILQSMLKAQDEVLKDVPKKELENIRIMASVIEKETALNKERPWVAAVIRNRLALHMPLQMDPTVIYGIWKRDGVFSGNIHRKDLHTDTPWNSYTRKGLPPTPICNPSAASLRAAITPADVNYLYFVANGTGGHAFAASLAEHQRNVRAWVNLERQR
ncbi:MAG: endolytic transglycosylase MltG [Mariprofundaceae bacterium]|nr:endolytic transglycosylase MltG [Mariprofundaceae bacterium]